MGAEKRPRHQRPPAREHRQPPQRHFLLMEQVIAPIDLRPQRLLPTRCPAAAARQEPEAVIQALRDFFDRQPHVGGRRRPAEWRIRGINSIQETSRGDLCSTNCVHRLEVAPSARHRSQRSRIHLAIGGL